MLKPELVRESPRRTGGDRSLAGGLQHRASAQLAKISDTGRVRGKCGRATGVSPHAGRLYRPSVGRFGCAGTRECSLMTGPKPAGRSAVVLLMVWKTPGDQMGKVWDVLGTFIQARSGLGYGMS